MSIYLDVVRFGAAIVVVLHHAWPILVPGHPIPWPGHDAVVVFFVLSGTVIAHATNRTGLTLAEYASHRLARIWSVAVPALLLSLAVSWFVQGAGLGEVAPPARTMGGALGSAFLSVVPFGQIWFMDVNPPLNAPFWSLNFEVWYYALFGAWLFAPHRWVTIGLITLVVGPKILLLLPVWLTGVALYWYRPKPGPKLALVVFVVTAAMALLFIQMDCSIAIRSWMIDRAPELMEHLGGARQFAGDFLLALIVAANFAAAASVAWPGRMLLRAQRPVRAMAGCTFSAYLYHAPLLSLGVLGLSLQAWQVALLMIVGIAGLSYVTEWKVRTARRAIRHIGRRMIGVRGMAKGWRLTTTYTR